jgi:TonB family protein
MTHALVVVSDEADLASRLLGAHAGVALIDAASVPGGLVRLVGNLRIQFPDLVLIVAGSAIDQADLAGQVTDGSVHRFLHKPVSAQRIKLFVEAAWRRHHEEHTGVLRQSTPAPPAGTPAKRSALPVALAAAAAVAIAMTLWWMYRPAAAPKPLPAPARVAASASPQAAALERMLNAAEKAILAGQVEEAARLVDSARKLQADNVRVVFLDAQLAKERERNLLAQARQAAATGNLSGALAVLDGAARDGRKSATVSETREELQQRQVDDRVKTFLRQAENRLAAGALLEPPQNNARFFIESARTLSPQDPGIASAQRGLGDRLVEQARQAMSSGRVADAERWVDASQEPFVDSTVIAGLKRDLQRMKASSAVDAVTRLTGLFNERLMRGALIDPEGDSAKTYLAQLTQVAPDHPATQLARQTLSARFVSAANEAAARRDIEQTQKWIVEARSAGASAAELTGAENAISQTLEQTAAGSAAPDNTGVVSAAILKRTRYVEPRFPFNAQRAGTSGWVDLEFQVLPNGRVGDVTVVASEPDTLFDEAAAEALRRWQYQPVRRNGEAVEQRARVRIRFNAE